MTTANLEVARKVWPKCGPSLDACVEQPQPFPCMLHSAIAQALDEAEERGWNAAIEKAALAECSRCKAGIPLVPVESTGNFFHLVDVPEERDSLSILCAANAVRALRMEG